MTNSRLNVSNVWTILKKDLKRAPKNGVVILAMLYPLLITVVVQVIFGQIFDPPPRIGVVDHGTSQVAQVMRDAPGVKFHDVVDEKTLWAQVERGELDIGLVFSQNFDADAKAGKKTKLDVKAWAQTPPQTFMKAEAVMGKAFMTLAPEPPMVMKRVKLTEQAPKPWVERLLPMIILLAFFVGGTFMTGFAIVDEKVRGTLRAVLTTPASMGELMMAKSIFSYGTAMAAGVITLAANDALGALSGVLIVMFTIAAIMTIELGVILGLLSKDISGLYGAIKGFGPVVVVAVLPYMFDAFPKWVAMLLPFWYVIEPIVEIVNRQASFGDVAVNMGIAAAICVGLWFAMLAVGRRTMRQLDAGHA